MKTPVALQVAAMRNTIAFAREIRIRLRDSRVIFASVVLDAAAGPDAFVVRPWGLSASTTLLYENVSRVAPVRRMNWETHQAICAMQARPSGRAVVP